MKLHAIIDACHSGSVMDLPYQAHVRGGYAQWEASYHYTRSHKVGARSSRACSAGSARHRAPTLTADQAAHRRPRGCP